MTEATRPPLTSVDMNLEVLGREAGAALLEMMVGRRFAGVRRAVLACHPRLVRRRSFGWDKKVAMIKSGYSPVPFADVHVDSAFWGEWLEIVVSRTIPSQPTGAEASILDSLKLPKPAPLRRRCCSGDLGFGRCRSDACARRGGVGARGRGRLRADPGARLRLYFALPSAPHRPSSRRACPEKDRLWRDWLRSGWLGRESCGRDRPR
jgi:hypothetical protein